MTEATQPETTTVKDVILNLAALASEIHTKYRIPPREAAQLVMFGISTLPRGVPSYPAVGEPEDDGLDGDGIPTIPLFADEETPEA